MEHFSALPAMLQRATLKNVLPGLETRSRLNYNANVTFPLRALAQQEV